MEILLAAFITVHTLDGHEAAVNPDQITNLIHGRDGEGNKLLTANVHCVINLTNGKFLSVVEDCAAVLRMIESREGPP